VERKGSTWSVHQKDGRHDNVLMELVEIWLDEKETEELLLAAQDKALPTRNYKVAIMKEQGSKKRRMCNARDETVMHILSECQKLAQGEYKKRHDQVASIIHWELRELYRFQKSKNWYDHQA